MVFKEGKYVNSPGSCFGYIPGTPTGIGVDGSITADDSPCDGKPVKGYWGAGLYYVKT